MTSSSPVLPVGIDNSRRYKFHSIDRLCSFLGIPTSGSTCLAYAPHARNAPHCSRKIHQEHQVRVPYLLADLVEVRIPSREADRLLEELSAYVVCGVTEWHQVQAAYLYRKWYENLWREYLRVNGVDPESYGWVPSWLARRSWVAEPGSTPAALESDSDNSDGSEEDDRDPEEAFPTPDSTTSDLNEVATTREPTTSGPDEIPSSHDARLQSSREAEVPPRPLGPPSNPRPLSRHAFSVYRDPSSLAVPGDLAEQTNTRTEGNPLALRQLDRNIPIPRSGNQTSFSWSHGVPETDPTQSAVSYHVGSSATADRSSPDGNGASSGDEPLATPDNEASEAGGDSESDDEDNVGEEEQTRAGYLGDQGSLGNVDDVDRGSGRVVQEEGLPVVGAIGSDESQPRQPDSGDSAEGGDSFATDMLALPDIYDYDATAETERSRDSIVDTTTITRQPTFQIYPQGAPRGQLKQLFNLMTQIVSKRRRFPGFIYAFARPSLPGFLKIGYTNANVEPRRPYPDPVDHRLARWTADCGHPIEEVFRAYIPCSAVQRIESLIHLTLRKYRRVEDPPCGPCDRRAKRQNKNGGKHKEWFQVDVQTARRAVDMWQLFSEQQPYDRFGRLVDSWSAKIDSDWSQARAGAILLSWVESMPQMIAELRRAELSAIIDPLRMLSLP